MSEKKTVKVVKAKSKPEPETTKSLFSDEPVERVSPSNPKQVAESRQPNAEPVSKATPRVSESANKATRKTKKKQTNPKLQRAILISAAVMVALLMFSTILNNSDDSSQSTDTQSSTIAQEITALNNNVGAPAQTDEGKVVWDDENVKITVYSINKAPDMFGSIECPVEVTFFFENKSQRRLGLLLTNSYVNNMKIAEYPLPASSGYCDPGTTGMIKLLFSYNKVGINSYSEIQSITTNFNVMDENDIEFSYDTSPVVVNIQLED